MHEDDFGRSLKDFGFLTPFTNDLIAEHRKLYAAWFTISEDLNKLGQRQLQRGADKALKVSSMDPLNIGVRLLIRTMSNFQGSLILIERGMAVEAQTLVRNCYENSFWIAAFVSDPEATLAAFKLDETKSQDSRADAYLRMVDKHGNTKMQADARRAFANRRAKSKERPLGLEQVAQLASWEPHYVFYKHISASSAHPSLNSLERYLERDLSGGWIGFILGPETGQIGKTLNLACHALISALAAFGQLIGESEDDQTLFDLTKRYDTLAGIDGAKSGDGGL